MSQQPTFHITKEHFVGVINSLHEQYVKDKQRSEAMSEIFNCESGFYDNSALVNAIFSFLHEVFPKDDDGHSEIEHYCYVLQFGKNGEEYESPEELFDRLVVDKFKGCGILQQIENNPVYSETNEDMVDALRNVLTTIGYPIAPEDAFIPTQEMIDQAENIIIKYPSVDQDNPSELFSKGEIVSENGKFDTKMFEGVSKLNPYIIDEAGQFPGHKTTISEVVISKDIPGWAQSPSYKGDAPVNGQARADNNPSPDETA